MRKPALYGLLVLCASLLFSLSSPFAQKPVNSNGKDSSVTPVSVSVDAIDLCDLDNQVTSVGSGLPLFDLKHPFSTSSTASCVPAEQCCKICSKGKACGDTCIRKDYTCHVGRGCACNQEEVCKN